MKYKIFKGISFEVQVCPDRIYGKAFKADPNINSDDAEICLNCTKKKCKGSKRCYEKRRDEILLEMRRMKKHRESLTADERR